MTRRMLLSFVVLAVPTSGCIPLDSSREAYKDHILDLRQQLSELKRERADLAVHVESLQTALCEAETAKHAAEATTRLYLVGMVAAIVALIGVAVCLVLRIECHQETCQELHARDLETAQLRKRLALLRFRLKMADQRSARYARP